MFFIVNNTLEGTPVKDCFVRIVTAPGEVPGQYGKKKIQLIFRNYSFRPFVTKYGAIVSGSVTPVLVWDKFPVVSVSLFQDEGEKKEVYKAEFLLDKPDK